MVAAILLEAMGVVRSSQFLEIFVRAELIDLNMNYEKGEQ